MRTHYYRLEKITKDGKAWEPVLTLDRDYIFLPVQGEAPTFLNTYLQPGYRWELAQIGG